MVRGATATSTRPSPSCGSHGGTLAILSGTRRDPRGYDVRLEVFGTADSIAVGVDERSPLRSVEPGVARRRAGVPRLHRPLRPAYRAELAAFVEAVRRGGESPCPLTEARAALAVAIAADRSRASGGRSQSRR